MEVIAECDKPVPTEMYLPRKSLEVVDLSRLEYLASSIFNQLTRLYAGRQRDVIMDKYWSKEIVAEELYYAQGHSYGEYLPGRYLTYKRLSDIIKNHAHLRDRSILEIGCGSGLSLVMFAKGGAKCTGLDKSYAALEFLRLNVEREGLQGITRDQGDFFSTGYADNQFDISYNLGVFEHLNQWEQEKLIMEMARITREIVFVAVPNSDSPLFKTLLCNEQDLESSAPGNIYPDRNKHYTVDLRDLLESVGFNLLSYSGILLAPSQDIKPGTLDSDATEFFRSIPKVKPIGEGKERIKNLIGFWELLEKATSEEQLRKCAWFRYAIGRKRK